MRLPLTKPGNKALAPCRQVLLMIIEPHTRNRTGRISDENFINALNRRYATIRGRYETIEQECETVFGVAALIETQDRVESDKVLMRRVLDAIEIVARDVDPDWDRRLIQPLYPRRRDGATGEITRTAAKVLRRARRPMKLRDLSKATAEMLGYESDEALLRRFDSAIYRSFQKKIGKHLGIDLGPPKRYFILEPASGGVARRGRRPSDVASIPSTPATHEPSQRLA